MIALTVKQSQAYPTGQRALLSFLAPESSKIIGTDPKHSLATRLAPTL